MATFQNQDEILAMIINAKNQQAKQKYIRVCIASKFILYAYRLSLPSVAKVS